MSFAVKRGRGRLTCRWPTATWAFRAPDRDAVLRALKPPLEDPKKLKVGQHAK